MEILYFGSLCDDELFQKNEKKKIPYFIAQYMYEKALCDELRTHDDINIEFAAIYQTEYFPKDNFIYKYTQKKQHNNPYRFLGFINIPFLRECTYYVAAASRIVNWAVRNRRTQEKCIFASTHFTPVSSAIVTFSKFFGIKRIVTFTDLSLFTFREERIKKMKFYKRIVMKQYIKKTDRLQQSYDGYILFSKQMNDIVNPNGMPYQVVEGIYNSNGLNLEEIVKRGNAIAHAGTLSYLVGIKNILDAFGKLKTDTELWLMGGGDMEDEIEFSANKDSRIKFLGFLSKAEVFKYLKKARLLVILRNIDDEYTQYSFPSKLFEYMVSGTPVLTTKLKGIPDEYYEYIYSVDSSDTDVFASAISDILSKPDDKLRDFALRARDFIINEKNARVQTEKILSLIKECVLN